MRNYHERDIRFYDLENEIEGDFMVDESGDFALTDTYESPRQDMVNRIRTEKGDWRTHPNIGADLEELEGEPNTRMTGEKAERKIYEALTYDHRFSLEDVQVRAVPTQIDEIHVFTMLDTDERAPIVVEQPIDL